jgi:endonuclease/exonuclease/phosphatase (EEP) superfamily protein YafD
MKIISWNILREVGATLEDVVGLITRERPDLLLMQEATAPFGALCDHVGGCYAWEPQPQRIHGLAMWSAAPWRSPPAFSAISRGAWFERICQIVLLDDVGIANVHLSHGQWLNRRQLREIAQRLPDCAAVLGDFNIVGPALLRGFRDVGPRWPTHRMGEIVPLRIDRCLARGLACEQAHVLPRLRSDHRPISVRLRRADMAAAAHGEGFKYRATAAAGSHRAA